MTKFWGKLFLINFIMGVATGIVQEFQFGMAWSEYCRFVGDVFGAPLAMEALLAFFVESTFLGLWIFGWERLRSGVHLACLWAASIGTISSAYFIIVANSWMQHPVGREMIDGRSRLTRHLGRPHQQHRARRRPAHHLRRARGGRRVPARHRLVTCGSGAAARTVSSPRVRASRTPDRAAVAGSADACGRLGRR